MINTVSYLASSMQSYSDVPAILSTNCAFYFQRRRSFKNSYSSL